MRLQKPSLSSKELRRLSVKSNNPIWLSSKDLIQSYQLFSRFVKSHSTSMSMPNKMIAGVQSRPNCLVIWVCLQVWKLSTLHLSSLIWQRKPRNVLKLLRKKQGATDQTSLRLSKIKVLLHLVFTNGPQQRISTTIFSVWSSLRNRNVPDFRSNLILLPLSSHQLLPPLLRSRNSSSSWIPLKRSSRTNLTFSWSDKLRWQENWMLPPNSLRVSAQNRSVGLSRTKITRLTRWSW